jgi:hypothetical protein
MSYDEPPELESSTEYPEPVHTITMTHEYLKCLNEMLYEWARAVERLPNGLDEMPQHKRVYDFFKRTLETTRDRRPY